MEEIWALKRLFRVEMHADLDNSHGQLRGDKQFVFNKPMNLWESLL